MLKVNDSVGIKIYILQFHLTLSFVSHVHRCNV